MTNITSFFALFPATGHPFKIRQQPTHSCMFSTG